MSLRSPRMRRALLLTLPPVTAAGLLGWSGVPAYAASLPAPPPGSQATPVDPSGALSISGRGFGAGIGMSQYGAEGAAGQGLSAAQILAFYYPTTQLTARADGPIRVGLTSLGDGPVSVAAQPGMTLSVGGGTPVSLPTGPTGWQVRAAGGGVSLYSLTGSTAALTAIPGLAGVLAAPVVFGAPAGVTVLHPDGTGTTYTGTIEVSVNGPGVLAVNTTTMAQYLDGVVPAEAPSSWLPAALQAQAIAARTYAEARSPGSYQICDTTNCQVYRGAASIDATGATTWTDPASTDAAVTATAGEVLIAPSGALASTMYSSSNGGQSVGVPGFPYLIAQADPYDGLANPTASWTASIPAADIAAQFGLAQVLRVDVTGRDGLGQWGGRVLSLQIDGLDASGNPVSVSTSGSQFAAAFGWPADPVGLRSTYFTVTGTTGPAPGTVSAAAPSPAGNTPSVPVNPLAAPSTISLGVGSTGLFVTEVQRVVGTTVDGEFGPLTQAAVRSWQSAHNLPGTGVVTYAVWQAMGLPVQPAPTQSAPVQSAPVQSAPVQTGPARFLAALAGRLGVGPLPNSSQLLAALTAGSLDRTAAATAAMALPAARAAQVDAAYQEVLGRPADPSGLATFSSLLDRGVPDEQVRALLAGSAEFYGRAGGSPAGFVRALYLTVLGRPADPGGLSAWTALVQRGADREQVALAFLRSVEAVQRQVNAAYEHVLGRPADPGGLAAWTAYLTAGGSSDGLYPQLYGSAEFLADAGG